ncbi:putative HTH DNA binding domain protein [Mycobacterium phage PP]|uniref:Putative HTH DNA binding domain protein n=1 Tax=Mycobacterium phage PP TaxID=2077134 RepID=A0A2Z5XVG2_9CAUD|nr:HTH DNA binding protein [Mycobacterium phage PP]BBC53844.1 putative HTH DNA binding domain protein [Mycobacterium phage PP]
MVETPALVAIIRDIGRLMQENNEQAEEIHQLRAQNAALLREKQEVRAQRDRLHTELQALRDKLEDQNGPFAQELATAEQRKGPRRPNRAGGPNRPNRKKLSDEDVRNIRALRRSGVKQSDIADSYDVNRATVSRIVRGVYHR